MVVTVSKMVMEMVLHMGIMGVLAMAALELFIVDRGTVSTLVGATISFSARGLISRVIRQMLGVTELCNLGATLP
jgi:hypothetical protein